MNLNAVKPMIRANPLVAGAAVSVMVLSLIGIDYVSCSGPRVPIARLAAAQAKLLENQYREPG